MLERERTIHAHGGGCGVRWGPVEDFQGRRLGLREVGGGNRSSASSSWLPASSKPRLSEGTLGSAPPWERRKFVLARLSPETPPRASGDGEGASRIVSANNCPLPHPGLRWQLLAKVSCDCEGGSGGGKRREPGRRAPASCRGGSSAAALAPPPPTNFFLLFAVAIKGVQRGGAGGGLHLDPSRGTVEKGLAPERERRRPAEQLRKEGPGLKRPAAPSGLRLLSRGGRSLGCYCCCPLAPSLPACLRRCASPWPFPPPRPSLGAVPVLLLLRSLLAGSGPRRPLNGARLMTPRSQGRLAAAW